MTELMALNMSDAVLMAGLQFAKGEVFTQPHECENPEHAESKVIPVLCMIVTDVGGKQHTMVMLADSSIAQAFADMEMYYYVKSLLELDN